MTFITPIIILAILLLNYFIYKNKQYPKKFFIITTSMIIIYSIVAIVIYYNNIHNGYNTGILFGDILNSHFCDEYKYNIDSNILLNHFKNGDISLWLNHQLPQYEFIDPQGHPSYGNYNLFVILLTFFKAINITSVLDLILIKIIIYIPTAIYFYKLCRIYLNEKFSLIALAIFSLLPGYILTNSLLMRDNLILFLTIILLYYIFSKNISIKSIPLIIVALLLLFKFRSYLILTMIATVIFTFKNSKKLFALKDVLYFAIIILTILFFVKFDFQVGHSNQLFSYAQIKALQSNFISTYGDGIIMLINYFYQTCIQIFFDPFFISFLKSGLIYLILWSIGNILGTIVSLSSTFGFIYLFIKNNKEPKLIYLIKFTIYFTALTAFIVMAKDSFIINRIALMWIPLFIIIILLPFNSFFKFKNKC